MQDVIYKRTKGTKMCEDFLEKTLAIEKKAVVCLIYSFIWFIGLDGFVVLYQMALEVNPGVVNVQEFERQPVPYKKEELKVSSNKTVSSIKSSAFKVVDLNHRVEELVEAANIISKEVDAVEFWSTYSNLCMPQRFMDTRYCN